MKKKYFMAIRSSCSTHTAKKENFFVGLRQITSATKTEVRTFTVRNTAASRQNSETAFFFDLYRNFRTEASIVPRYLTKA